MNAKLSGSIYLNKNRYWWKVRLPGKQKTKAYPLRPVGAKFATNDRAVAEEVAKQLWQDAIFNSTEKSAGRTGSIAGLVKDYLAFAKRYYCDAEGKTTQEPENIRYALTPLVEHCSAMPAEEFGPLKLKAIREKMIERGWCRNVINQRIGIVKRMFRWALSEELIPKSVYHSLQSVEGLKQGRSGVRETKPVEPIAENYVRAILEYTTPTVATMVELQLLTGMRSTELCLMRPCDIERDGKIWLYRPAEHKTKYRGHSRTIAIGPKSQQILRPFLLRKLDGYCFTPTESENHRQHTRKTVKPHYDKDSYRKAIIYAIKQARAASVDVPLFHPHQLRHTCATRLRKEMGLDAARAVLGHRNLKITDDYAELDAGLAANAMLKLG